MAPTKSVKPSGGSKSSGGEPKGKTSKLSSGISKTKPKAKPSAPSKMTSERKTKPLSHRPEKKKKRVYTEKELNIPSLNGIRPAGVIKARGQKKGKVFVDDREGMMAILAMVQAEKEGDIESKIQKARRMEELREAKKAEAEKREGERKRKFEGVKDEVRKERGEKRLRRTAKGKVATEEVGPVKTGGKSKKKVSFG